MQNIWWFKYNNFKAITTKCHFFLSPYQSATIKHSIIKGINSKKLLGVTIDSNCSFEEHINSLCRKFSQRLRALSWISQYISPNKKRILFKTFLTFQFNDCPLVWMCHSWTFNRINNIHHRAVRILYQDKKSNFEKLLQKDKSVSLHMKNLQYLATEIFKVKNSLSPIIMHEVFNFQENKSFQEKGKVYI